jgi:hypothetical protein
MNFEILVYLLLLINSIATAWLAWAHLDWMKFCNKRFRLAEDQILKNMQTDLVALGEISKIYEKLQ